MEQTFRQAMQRLETIVMQLEKNELELEEAIQIFEEGLSLAQKCDQQLKHFEDSVAKLVDTYQNGDTNE